MTREFVKNLLWLRSSFENRNPEQVAMIAIRNLVAIHNPETFWNGGFGGFDQGCDQGCNQGRDQGCDSDRNPESQPSIESKP